MQCLPLIASLSLSLTLPPTTSLQEQVWTDIDADGLPDVVLIEPDGALRLFLSDANGAMREADAGWGLVGLEGVRSVVAGDADGDGRVDLFLAGALEQHRLMRNLGTSFIDVTERSGLSGIGVLQAADWIDYDADGLIDLCVVPVGGGLILFQNSEGLAFTPIVLTPDSESQDTGSFATPNADDEQAKKAGRRSQSGQPRELRGTSPTDGSSPGGRNAVIPGSRTQTSRQSLNQLWACAQDLADKSGGPCIPASSTPTPGHLLPLGQQFFIDSLGQIGFNTMTPEVDLHMQGNNRSELRVAAHNLFGATDAALQLSLDRNYDDGMELLVTDEGLSINARVPAQGGVPRTFGPHIFVERSAATKVGINENTPETLFHVGGISTLDGDLNVRRPDDVRTVQIDPDYTGGGGSARMYLYQSDGALGMVLDGENSVGSGSKLTMYGDNGSLRVELDADDAGAAFLRLYKADNSVGINLDADQNGDARITCEVLEITGGADLVESFNTGGEHCLPGTVVAIDPDRPGELTPSREAYDRRVAGVVSGAGGVQPGLHLGQTGVASGSTPVALTGRVYVRCNGENGPIRPGDLLTSSSTVGTAMRASDSERSFGAVIGKAMTGLEADEGLVLVLVNLQ